MPQHSWGATSGALNLPQSLSPVVAGRYHYNVSSQRLDTHINYGSTDNLSISSVTTYNNLWAVVMDCDPAVAHQRYLLASSQVLLDAQHSGFPMPSLHSDLTAETRQRCQQQLRSTSEDRSSADAATCMSRAHCPSCHLDAMLAHGLHARRWCPSP